MWVTSQSRKRFTGKWTALQILIYPWQDCPRKMIVRMRERRNRSLETPAFSVTASLLGKVLQIEAVKDANIFENYTSAFDSDKQLNPHTIWLIVDAPKGSNDFENELAYLLAYNKTAGTGMKGQKSHPLTLRCPIPKVAQSRCY